MSFNKEEIFSYFLLTFSLTETPLNQMPQTKRTTLALEEFSARTTSESRKQAPRKCLGLRNGVSRSHSTKKTNWTAGLLRHDKNLRESGFEAPGESLHPIPLWASQTVQRGGPSLSMLVSRVRQPTPTAFFWVTAWTPGSHPLSHLHTSSQERSSLPSSLRNVTCIAHVV